MSVTDYLIVGTAFVGYFAVVLAILLTEANYSDRHTRGKQDGEG